MTEIVPPEGKDRIYRNSPAVVDAGVKAVVARYLAEDPTAIKEILRILSIAERVTVWAALRQMTELVKDANDALVETTAEQVQLDELAARRKVVDAGPSGFQIEDDCDAFD